MLKPRVGILHPGEMGISVAVSAKNSGHVVYWTSEGRSQTTHDRATKYGLVDAGTLANLCHTCDVILSVCPPDAAEDVARQVIAHDFRGLYVDGNAIAPQRAERIGRLLTEAEVSFVDGGIIGGPAWRPKTTWLYLSGPRAEDAAALFAAGPLETTVLGDSVSQASALKMCYAAYTKGTTALLAAILATAESLNVRDALQAQWMLDGSDLAEQASDRVRRSTLKAWRFVGEMEEITATFEAAGLPSDFHQGAADIYRRLAGFKDANPLPSLDTALTALLRDDL